MEKKKAKTPKRTRKDKTIHLVCNAHLDPVWLWEWQEGAAEAISTFRAAADFCEEFDGFVFNHNEVILYRWVEEYEPELFAHIQKLVKQGRWKIMGGWHVQPDCNMPSGESIVRQILTGRRYFGKKFGVRPTTALNLDPFGHSRGLVQILAKSGYDSYVHCRPDNNDCPLPGDVYRWIGFDGSEIVGHRTLAWYGSGLGQAAAKLEDFMKHHGHRKTSMMLWGVGNHGGGASRADLHALGRMMTEATEHDIVHSTMEDFFGDVRRDGGELPRVEKALNPWAVGCYTSQVRIKQKHRHIENELFAAEKMSTMAWLQGLMEYPADEIAEALYDLLTCEFHDILPGSSIQPAEEQSLRVLDHGIEILERVKARAFFALGDGQKKAAPGVLPVMVFNHHPYDIDATVECEFQLPDGNWGETFTGIRVEQAGRVLPSQIEKELSNIPIDWRKKIVFKAKLKAGEMNRFDCIQVPDSPRPIPTLAEKNGKIRFRGRDLEVDINTKTGLVDRFRVKGKDVLKPGAFCPLVIQDDEDPWGMRGRSYRNVLGPFKPVSEEKSAEVSGVKGATLPAVRVVEEGAIRTVVEAVLEWNSSIVVLTYHLPAEGTEAEVGVRVYWNEKGRMLKLSIPTTDKKSGYVGEVMYGRDELWTNGDECVAQKWTAAVGMGSDSAVTVINSGTYGSDFCDGEIRMTLLRSPGYSAHPIGDRNPLPQNRFSPRIDQGERMFTFWVNAGPVDERLEAVPREAQVHNEKPFALSFSPTGLGEKPAAGAKLSDTVVQLAVMKKSEEKDDLVVRLFEPTGKARTTVLTLPALKMKIKVAMKPFEIKTLRISPRKRTWKETNLIEE